MGDDYHHSIFISLCVLHAGKCLSYSYSHHVSSYVSPILALMKLNSFTLSINLVVRSLTALALHISRVLSKVMLASLSNSVLNFVSVIRSITQSPRISSGVMCSNYIL